MATSPKAFLIELYREYLADASFLYDQRRTLLADPEISWRDLASFDERLEACLDGLVVGGELAIEVCKDRLGSGDAGEIYAAVRVFCRQGLRATVLAIPGKLSLDESERLAGVADGLKHDCPEAWLTDLGGLEFAGEQAEAQLIIFARVAGYRRWKPAAAKLAGALPKAGPSAIPDALWAIGRTGPPEMRSLLNSRLRDANERVRASAAEGLLALRDPSVGEICGMSAVAEPWAAKVGAVAGGNTARATLQAIAAKPNTNSETILALGMLGDPSAVPVLIDLLAKGVQPSACAQAIDLIVGAGIRETVFVPEPDAANSTLELRPDGKPYGSTVNRLTLNPKQWRNWWDECAPKFNAGERYRLGRIWSPEAVLATIEESYSPSRIREWSAEELRMHWGYNWRFETEMPVTEQLTALSAARSWVNANVGRILVGN